jgi:hypothetical protein
VILHHFTMAKHLPSIFAQGILPSSAEYLTLAGSAARPIVWLTTAETMDLSAIDIEWLLYQQKRGTFTAQEVEDHKVRGMVTGRDCRITVRLERSKRLLHYASWLGWQTCPTVVPRAKAILEMLGPSAREHWFIYVGTIQPHRINAVTAFTDEAFAIADSIGEPMAAAAE